MSIEKNAAFGDMSDLLNANMDDLEALPPLAVPPSGHYTLRVVAETANKEGKEYIATKFSVISVNEVKDAAEADDVKPGQMFNNSTYLRKKDGTTNTTAIAAFRTFLDPFKIALFPDQAVTVGELMSRLADGVDISASLTRTARRDPTGEVLEDQYNFRLKDVTVI